MKIFPLSQLRVEDFPKEQQKWLPLLFGQLNQYLTSFATALQQNLDFLNNFLGQQANLSFTWVSAAKTLPMKFQITMTGTPLKLVVCQALENKVPVILHVAWQNLNGNINITDIARVSNGVISTPVVGAAYTLCVRIET